MKGYSSKSEKITGLFLSLVGIPLIGAGIGAAISGLGTVKPALGPGYSTNDHAAARTGAKYGAIAGGVIGLLLARDALSWRTK